MIGLFCFVLFEGFFAVRVPRCEIIVRAGRDAGENTPNVAVHINVKHGAAGTIPNLNAISIKSTPGLEEKDTKCTKHTKYTQNAQNAQIHKMHKIHKYTQNIQNAKNIQHAQNTQIHRIQKIYKKLHKIHKITQIHKILKTHKMYFCCTERTSQPGFAENWW